MEKAIHYDGFEEALLGYAERFGWTELVAVYDKEKVIEIIMRDGASYEDAMEHFYYNVVGGWVGEQTPIFLERNFNENF